MSFTSSSFDIFFIILGCYFVIRGCFRGFVGEVLTFVGFSCAIFSAFKLSGSFGRALAAGTGINAYAAQLLAMFAVWLIVTLVFAMLRRALKSVIEAASLGGFDRLLGIFTGGLKIIVVIYVVLIGGLLLAPIKNPSWMTRSDALRHAGRHWPAVRSILIDFELLDHATDLPDGTLEQILRPYRTGEEGPEGYEPGKDRT